MAPRRVDSAVPRWQRWSGCALVLLAASGCSDAPTGSPTDAQSGWLVPGLAEPQGSIASLTQREGGPPVVLWRLPQPAIAELPLATTPAPVYWGPQLLAPRELTAEDMQQSPRTDAPSGAATETARAEAAVADRAPEAQPPSPDAWTATYPKSPVIPVTAPAEPTASPTAALLADATPVTTGEPTDAMVCQRAQEKIRRAYALAQRGAYFAARSELIDALRSIAEAKDQDHAVTRRSAMLASGLRALDEAGDFSPSDAAADAELNIPVIVSSHRTPVGKSPEAAALMPQQLADLYLRYAQKQLGDAVSGEPAGSMALHALGKVYDHLGRLEPERRPLANRRAFALQQAALVARSDNYLAAHELGVLLAESGHFVEAQILLSQVVAREPNPVVLRNLANVERKLGREQAALSNERQAQLIAARTGAPSANGVSWVPPQALAQTSDGLPPNRRMAAAPQQPGAPVPPQYRR